MPGTFDLTLRTQAPVITWGSPTGNVPGLTLAVPYSIDEPGITAARLIDFDGVIFPLTVEADRVTVNLPDTVALGQASIEADVEDDVLNAATRTRTLVILASLAPTPGPAPQIVGGIPRETPRLRRSTRTTTSRVRALTTSRAITRAVRETRAVPIASYGIRIFTPAPSVLSVRTLARQTAHLEVATGVTVSTGRLETRDDSQIALLALLLLD